MSNSSDGFTLLELVISLALWAILLSGVSGAIWLSNNSAAKLANRQNAMENARIALDTLSVNLQMSEEIFLDTLPNGRLRLLRTYQASPDRCPALFHENCNPLNCIGGFRRHGFEFRFNPSSGRLNFGGNNELASHLSDVKLKRDGDFIHITIITDDTFSDPITLYTVLDMRFRFE